MRRAILEAVCGRPAIRTWSVLVIRAVLLVLVGIIAFLNPVVALAISVAFFAVYKMLDVDVFNRHRAVLRRDAWKEGGRASRHR